MLTNKILEDNGDEAKRIEVFRVNSEDVVEWNLRSLNPKYLQRLPHEVIMTHIIPYTYNVQSAIHLHDIRSFKVDYDLLKNVYCNYNEMIILYDLVQFCNNNITPIYEIEPEYENIIARHFSFRNKTNDELNKFVFLNIHRRMLSLTERKICFLFGLLTPNERTTFFNTYILNEYT